MADDPLTTAIAPSHPPVVLSSRPGRPTAIGEPPRASEGATRGTPAPDRIPPSAGTDQAADPGCGS
ncbi:hypothetical protein [Streptomyces sp. NPDC047981]|uniref:hypothetical protein n=1 Tax=Streptomyces sp. NPDC047981 TaxID=3154610 RepID=UPI003413D557